MVKFKHQNGGITEVLTEANIKRLRADKNYIEVVENASKEVIEETEAIEVIDEVETIEEVVEDKPLQ